jgi:NADH:ubiquinone oxidoreductase subunit K
MKGVWKGVVVGGIVGFVFGLMLIKFASSESIFRIPLTLALKVVCPSTYSCSDVMGFVMFTILFTVVFYTLVGVGIGILVARWRR